jgi:ABC-2 type transport system permease protein
MGDVSRELRFILRDRIAVVTLAAAFALSLFSVVTGIVEVGAQRETIDRLENLTTEDRNIAIEGQADPGGAGYYAYHFTYDPPSNLAFAAEGVRDTLPWKHRIRMLALEGQIYEADTGNPELSFSGRLDFAFVASVLMPLFLILLLHDGIAGERRAGRHDLLAATSASGEGLFATRAVLKTALLLAAVVVPFLLGAIWSASALQGVLIVLVACALSAGFWLIAGVLVTRRLHSGSVSAATLLGLWLAVALAVPALGKLAAERFHTVPEGGELLLAQREAVNDAWDLPKEETMQAFLARYPEWCPYAEVSRPFEWKWYYAFQQVGDQSVENMSKALREGVAERDRFMGWLAFLSPTLASERLIEAAAETGIAAYQDYEACVRAFHADLRAFHYPMLFGTEEYSPQSMAELPRFEPHGCPADTGGDR